MNDQQLLEVLATTDVYPATRSLPEGWVDGGPPDAQESETMSTIQTRRTIEPQDTPRSPQRRRGVIAAIVTLVMTIAVVGIISIGGDEETATSSNPLDPQIRAAALSGEPLAVAEAWWWAYWSGDVGLISQLTDPEVTSLGTLDELIGDSEFQAALHNGEHWWTVSDCQPILGFDDRYLCELTSTATHIAYRLEDGSTQTFNVAVSDAGQVTSYNYWAVFTGDTPNAIFGPAREANGALFDEVCKPIADGNFGLGPDFYQYLRGLGTDCGEYLREFILSNPS